MKSILLICSEYPILNNRGGVASFIRNLALLLAEQGHNVEVMTSDGEGQVEKVFIDKKVKVRFIRYISSNKFFNYFYYRFPFGLIRSFLAKNDHLLLLEVIDWNVFSCVNYFSLYKKKKFDVIHAPSFGYPALLALFISKRIPHILHIQSTQELLNKFDTYHQDKVIRKWIEDISIKYLSKHIVTCSEGSKDLVAAEHPSVKERISCIYNFIDIDPYLNTYKNDIHNIVFMGRLDYRKGTDILLEAFVQLAKSDPKAHLWMIGEDIYNFPYHDKYISFKSLYFLKDIAEDIRERIHILPRIDDRKFLIDLLKKIKGIAVFPSRHETWGFVVTEAMAMGYIVIASKNGGATEMIEHNKNGFLISPNTKSLHLQLNKIMQLSDKELRKISQEAVKKIRSNYNFESTKKEFTQLYADTL